MRQFVFTSVGIAMLCCLTTSTPAQITLDRVVIGAGGGTMSNGPLRMDLTIGQPAIGIVQAGGLEGDLGFWWQVPNSIVAVEGERSSPAQFALPQNTPNPFRGSTAISYAIPKGQHVPVFIGVFNVQGGLVKTLIKRSHDPGQFQVVWDGSGEDGAALAAGLYFFKIQAGNFQRMRKTVLLK